MRIAQAALMGAACAADTARRAGIKGFRRCRVGSEPVDEPGSLGYHVLVDESWWGLPTEWELEAV